MQQPEHQIARSSIGMLAWLFPATYFLHILEEGLAGQGFAAWISDFTGNQMPEGLLWTLNAIGLAAMLLCATIVARRPEASWLLASMAALVFTNGLLHAGASILTASYSPGLATGLFLWVPLGGLALVRLRRPIGHRFLPAILGGLGVHALVSWLALTGGKLMP